MQKKKTTGGGNCRCKVADLKKITKICKIKLCLLKKFFKNWGFFFAPLTKLGNLTNKVLISL